jgi:hypothetical protein
LYLGCFVRTQRLEVKVKEFYEATNSEIVITESNRTELNPTTKKVQLTCTKTSTSIGAINVFLNQVKVEAKCERYTGVIFEDFYCLAKSIEYDTSSLIKSEDFTTFDCIAEGQPDLKISVKLFKSGK